MIGPQYDGDSPFAARMRFHQSWYRDRILGVPHGSGPRPESATLYGNMLTQGDGDRGLNFLTPKIFGVARERMSQVTGMTEPFRLLCNMLSSQPMCFNLFAPLRLDTKLATNLIRAAPPTWLSETIKTVSEVRVEYALSRKANT